MKKNIIKSTSIALFALMFIGCTTPVTPNNNNTDNNSSVTDNKTPVTENQQVNFVLTQKDGEKGAENPIGPEDISSVIINGVTIPASDIEFEKGAFTTKAEGDSDYKVIYEGAGKYYAVNKTTGKVLENRALIIFNLLNSKTPMVLPLLKGVLDNNLRLSIDLSTGNVFGGVTKEDGTIDNTKPVFKIGTDGKLTVTEPSGKQQVFARNDSDNTNLPDPEKTVELSQEEVKKQVEGVSNNVSATSPIAEYIGLWLYEGLGQKIIGQFKDLGQNKFSGSATVGGKKYSGEGTYNPTGKNDTLTLKVPDDQMHIEVKKAGKNAMQLTLLSTSKQELKVFINAPVNLQRVRVTE